MYVGPCEHLKPGPWVFKCPREKGVMDKKKCSEFREDCGHYSGTVAPRKAYSPEYHGNPGGIADDDDGYNCG